MIDWLFDPTDFVTRDHCGTWPWWMSRTYVAANVAIFLSYTWIAIALWVVYARKLLPLEKPRILIWFGTFIMACGFSHLTDVTVFKWPVYHLYTLVFAGTAVVSTLTAIQLPAIGVLWARLRPAVDYVNLSKQLQARLLAAEETQQELKRHNQLLAARLHNLELLLETEGWTTEKAQALAEMKGALAAFQEFAIASA